MWKPAWLGAGLFVVACSPVAPPPDESSHVESDALLSDSDPLARPVLRLVERTSSEAELQALGVKAADAALVMAHRRGPDGVLDTDDDDPFQRVDELAAAMRASTRNGNLSKLRNKAVGRSDLSDDACEAEHVRRAPLPLFVTPGGGFGPVKDLMDGAETTIEVTMYQLSSQPLIAALGDAAARGVRVRVLLDRAQTQNTALVAQLDASGVEAKRTSSRFVYTHEKTMTIDGQRTLVFSGNFDRASFETGRNYGVVTSDPEDVWDMEDLFEADWDDTPIDPVCTRLVLAPTNASSRVVALIDAATDTLDVEAMYASDNGVLSAIERATSRGVAVRVLFNDPKFHVGDASQEAHRLMQASIPVKRLPSRFIHAKVLVVDGAEMFVGSENFSANSLKHNREVGLRFALSPDAAALASSTFAGDWAAAVPF